MVAGAAAGATLAILGRWFTNVDLLNCGTGLDALGCAIASFGLNVLLVLAAAGLVNYVVLRAQRVGSALPIAGLSLLMLAAWWFLIEPITGGRGIRMLPLAATLILANLLFDALLRWLPASRVTIPLLAVAVVAAGFPLAGIGSRIDRARYQRDQDSLIQSAGFTTYVTAFVPRGYVRTFVTVHPRYPGSESYSEAQYLYGHNNPGEPGPFTIVSAHAPASYAPPTNCGTARPFSDRTVPCTEVGRSAASAPIYWDGARGTNVGVYFVKLGDTLVTIETESASGLQLPDVIRAVNSLRPFER